MAVTLQDVREFALPLPRTYERTIRDRVKFKVGQYVYLALSRDETTMGFAFPKQDRDGLIASDPAVQLGGRPALRDRPRRAAGDRRGRVADGGAETASGRGARPTVTG